MLTIINSFFLNLCILFTLFTISFLPFRNRPRLTPKSPLKGRILLGVQTGVVALILLANALPLEGILIDLRSIPISLAVLFGGWVSGTVAAVIFLTARFLMVTDGAYIGFYLAVLTMIGLVLPISLLRLKLDNTRNTLLIFTTISVAVFGAAIYYALPLQLFYPVIFAYVVMAYGGAYAAYRLLQELRLNVEAKEYALILVDIDHFKRVNDTYGHDVGDDVLRELGMLLVAESDERHLVGRFGGEEFLIIMPNANREDVTRLAESIREKVSTFPFETSAGTLHITVSLGACHSNDIEVDSVLKHADEALYHAKESGRNRFILAS